MSLLERIRTWIGGEQTRSSTANPSNWFVDWLGGRKTTSGVRVTPTTALGYSAYFASIRNISEDVAKLPLHVYRRMQPRGREIAEEHPIERLIHRPNPEMTAMSFRETMTSHALGWQGGFAEIQMGPNGQPVALWPLDPTSVRIRYISDASNAWMAQFVRPGERIAYEVTVDQGANIILDPFRVLHLRGLGYDGITSYILANIAAEAFGSALASQRHAAGFFGNGINSSGVLQVPEALSDEAYENLRKSFAQRHGGPANANKPIVLEEGVTWTPTSQKASDAQMIENRVFDVNDVARWFRMPPHKLQHLENATFSNIEQQSIEYVNDTMMPWLVRWEQELQRKLLADQSRRFEITHVIQALLRGDMAARSAFYREQFQVGALSPNDIRELEDRNPIDGGDTYMVNGAMMPLEHVLDPPQPEPPFAPGVDSPQGEADSDDSNESDEAERGIRRAHASALAAVLERVYALEVEKIARKGPEWYEEPERIEQVRRHAGTTCDAFVESLAAVRGFGTANGAAVGFCQRLADAYVQSVRSRVVDGRLPADDDWITAFAADQIEGFSEVTA